MNGGEKLCTADLSAKNKAEDLVKKVKTDPQPRKIKKSQAEPSEGNKAPRPVRAIPLLRNLSYRPPVSMVSISPGPGYYQAL